MNDILFLGIALFILGIVIEAMFETTSPRNPTFVLARAVMRELGMGTATVGALCMVASQHLILLKLIFSEMAVIMFLATLALCSERIETFEKRKRRKKAGQNR